MSIEHLSEKKIQQYLDDKDNALGIEDLKHLQTCDQCQGVVQDYEIVYSMLGQESEESLPVDFASRTMERILGAQQSPVWSRLNFLWVAIGSVSCLIALWYTIDLKAILDAATSFTLQQTLSNSPFVSSLRDFGGKFGDSLPIIIFAALVLVAVGLADKLILRQKASRAYFISV